MAKTVIITGVGGLVGSACAELFAKQGYDILGIDNDHRRYLLDDDRASTAWNVKRLGNLLGAQFKISTADVREASWINKLFAEAGPVAGVIHCAAQTAHEGEVREDFDVNVGGTLNVLSAWKMYVPEAALAYLSTIKVYGEFPNRQRYHYIGPKGFWQDAPAGEATRLDLSASHRFFDGFDETLPVDQNGLSSFFGRSKTCADLYVQEYAAQFNLKAACFRPGCIAGGAHAAVESHGMLGYMMRCAYEKQPYTVYGYDGLQVRDQIHADDVARAIGEFVDCPDDVHIVFNLGGGRDNAISVNEAIKKCEQITGNKMKVTYAGERRGDHKWWITDNGLFTRTYPQWTVTRSVEEILTDILTRGRERWEAGC